MSYYGVRYKLNGKTTDLFTTYFTSSKYVKQYMTDFGLPDVIEVRKKFDTALDAKRWEERVIDKGKLFSKENWLNCGNNGSFKNIIMDDEMKMKISNARKKNYIPRTVYNNGIKEIHLKLDESVPDGFFSGVLMTPKRLAHIEKITKGLSIETRKAGGVKTSLKTKGRPKPEGFGEKLSKATKGKSRPAYNFSPEEKVEISRKISESRKNLEKYKFFHNSEGVSMSVKVSMIDTVDLTIWKPGNPAKGKWYNDGNLNIYVRFDSDVDTSALTKGKIKTTFVYCTNGIKNIKVKRIEDIPDGFHRGKTQTKQQAGTYRFITNGEVVTTIGIDEPLPTGYVYGKIYDRK